jgi:hypothetical protein
MCRFTSIHHLLFWQSFDMFFNHYIPGKIFLSITQAPFGTAACIAFRIGSNSGEMV